MIWIQANPDQQKIQDDRKMPGSGLWTQKKSKLDPDPDRSLVGNNYILDKVIKIEIFQDT